MQIIASMPANSGKLVYIYGRRRAYGSTLSYCTAISNFIVISDESLGDV